MTHGLSNYKKGVKMVLKKHPRIIYESKGHGERMKSNGMNMKKVEYVCRHEAIKIIYEYYCKHF